MMIRPALPSALLSLGSFAAFVSSRVRFFSVPSRFPGGPTAMRLPLLLLIAITLPMHASLADVLPLEGHPVLLRADQARWLGSDGLAKDTPPKLQPVADKDGFADTQMIAPLQPEDGAVSWTLDVKKKGRYLVTLEFQQMGHGNAFEIQLGDSILKGFAPGTRGGMVLLEAGAVELDPGTQAVIFRNTSAPDRPKWTSVGSLYLRPASLQGMSKPEIREAIATLKPRTLPTELAVPALFSDHMVLQRDTAVPVWGRAKPGAEVTVRCQAQIKRTTTDSQGHWRLQLDPMQAGGPIEMEVQSDHASRSFKDILVGEVWFGSGQSNMEVSVDLPPNHPKFGTAFEGDADTRALLESGIHPHIRISAITRDHRKDPAWFELTRENCLGVPALMSCTAILLHRKLNVPIGLVIRCESSSPSGYWVSRDVVERDPDIQKQISEYAETGYPAAFAAYQTKLQEWEASDKTRPQPLPPPLAGEKDPIAANGGHYDTTGIAYHSRIAGVIPFAVRGIVWDQGESGTGIGGADQSVVMPALVRSWRAAWGRSDLPFLYVDKRVIRESHRSALAQLPATARVEYQGLSMDNHPPDKAAYARRLFTVMESQVYSGKPESPSNR
ncbi:MAG: hypothetical protein RLZZ244_2004 [Verrucomicrobiota bacterium]